MALETEIDKFMSRLERRIRSDQTFSKITEDLKHSEETWDKAARRRIGKIVREVFRQCFPEECESAKDAEEAVYVEGQGTPRWWKPPYKIFGSKGVYPDIAILIPKSQKRITIELDHSETRRKEVPGSKFKMALAKASFGYISQDWDYCFLFFWNHSGKSMKQYLNAEIERRILRNYEEEFHTRVILFE